MLEVGFAAACITPPAGAEIPGLFERRTASGVADDLFVRAVAVAGKTTTVAIAQVDAIALPRDVVRAARARIRRETGIPAQCCLAAATHTHSGGPVAGIFSSREDPKYLEQITGAIAETVAKAWKGRQPAFAGTAVAHAPAVAFNRRFLMRDGTQVTHPGKMHPDIICPAGLADDTVTTVGFRHAKTFQPLGCIVNFGCHATHMNGVFFSADYPRWVVDTLQAAHGEAFGVVFLNAPCGDVTQMDNLSPRAAEFGPYWCERTGRAVGAAALLGLATTDYVKGADIGAASTHVRSAIRESTPAERKRARALSDRSGESGVTAETLYARELLEVERMRGKSRRVSLEVQAIRIADTLLWTVPGELFQAFALEIRARSPFCRTCGVELANGYYGYICTPEAYGGGGYEVRIARSSYLAENTGARIVEAAAGLSETLYDQARKELNPSARRFFWPTVEDPALDGIRSLEKRRRG